MAQFYWMVTRFKKEADEIPLDLNLIWSGKWWINKEPQKVNHNFEFKAIHVSIVYDHLQLHVIQFTCFEITIMALHHHNKYTCACIVIDLCHAAAILFQEIKKALYLHC